MKKKLVLSMVAGAALLTLAACSSNNATSSSSSTKASSSASLSGKIVAGGSTALQPLVTTVSQEFMTKNPNVSIDVQPGGSGAGLTGVANGTFQIGNSDIFAEEKTGIDASKIKDNQVATVGVAPIVNQDVADKVKSLTQQQLIDIFSGKTTNWSAVGGPSEAITLIGRTTGSGTRVLFDNFGLNKGTELASEVTQDATGAAAKAVSTTPGAISYIAFSGLEGVTNIKAMPITFEGGSKAVDPTNDNVIDNSWKIWGYEHMYTSTTPDEATTALIKAVKNDTKDLKAQGYIEITAMKGSRTVDGTWTAK
ncbi:MAG TPA: phosphate ABC transporter substrate-binding protein [Lactovum miscens]|uniref:phosphate ABC transporter substrate-binding protein n=1 Tax=Lactovum miscens TaxID=190387 RepID=UPI002ED8BE97